MSKGLMENMRKEIRESENNISKKGIPTKRQKLEKVTSRTYRVEIYKSGK